MLLLPWRLCSWMYHNDAWSMSRFLVIPQELRQLPEHKHDKLRNVKISGFSSAKSLVELACHILGSATSLEWLTLDTKEGHGVPGCSVNRVGKCTSMERDMILEAHRALWAVQVYIKPKVPSTVKLHVLGPCSRCHTVELTEACGPWYIFQLSCP